MARSTRLAWGALSLVTGGTGCMTTPGDLAKNKAANSSTMKGPKGLASESIRRRCRTAKTARRRVRGCFCVRPPEIAENAPRKLCMGGSL